MVMIEPIIEKEMRRLKLTPVERYEIKEEIENKLNTFPPGSKLKRTIDGWSIVSPEGDIISLNEKNLIHSIPGGKARFDFMGTSIE